MRSCDNQLRIIYFCGIGLFVLSSGISWFAIRQLGRYFTIVVAVRPGQLVIQSGPYRIIRHPSYSAQLLMFLVYAVALTNLVSVPAVMVPIVAGCVFRVVFEDRAP